jgi:hypothetical protein
MDFTYSRVGFEPVNPVYNRTKASNAICGEEKSMVKSKVIAVMEEHTVWDVEVLEWYSKGYCVASVTKKFSSDG